MNNPDPGDLPGQADHPSHPPTQSTPGLPVAGWRALLLLAILQGVIALALIERPLSLPRLGLAAILLAVTLGVTWLLVESWRRQARFEARAAHLESQLSRPRAWRLALIATGLVFLLSGFLACTAPELTEPFSQGLLLNLMPLLVWVGGLALQTCAFLLVEGFRLGHIRHGPGAAFYVLLVLLAGLFVAWGWAISAAVPAAAQFIGWNETGTPLVELQVLAAWLAGLGTLAALHFGSRSVQRRGALYRILPDILLVVLIWLSAVIAWQSQPIIPNWFVTQKTPPNNESYPASDARIYDLTAQGVLIGRGFREGNSLSTRRPLQALLFVAWHSLAGQDYESVVFYQILALACLPVLVYLLGRTLHSRTAGVIAAVLVIFRETNGLLLADSVTSTNVKLLMADLPSALAVTGFTLLVVLWLQAARRHWWLGMVSGGTLGLVMLIRPESITLALVPAVLGAWAWLPGQRRAGLRFWLKGMLLFAAGLALVLAPWMMRNWSKGGFLLLNPTYQSQVVQLRLYEPPELPVDASTPPGEAGPKATRTPASTPPVQPGSPAPKQPPQAGQGSNGPTATVILANFLHSQMQALLILPATWRGPDSLVAFAGSRSPEKLWQACCSLTSYTRRLPYWRPWDGRFMRQSSLPLLVNSLLLVTGLYYIWKGQKQAGMAPLAILLVYIAGYASFRTSGGRYLQAVDWVVVLYFSAGLAQASLAALGLATEPTVAAAPAGLASPLQAEAAVQDRPAWRTGLLLAAGLLLLGALLPLVEKAFPVRYTPQRRQAMLNDLLAGKASIPAEGGQPVSQAGLQNFLKQGGMALAVRALYPHYYPAGKGESSDAYDPFRVQTYPRLGITALGDRFFEVALPLPGKPSPLKNGADVLILLCPNGEVLAVAAYQPTGQIKRVYWRSSAPAAPACPLPAIEPAN